MVFETSQKLQQYCFYMTLKSTVQLGIIILIKPPSEESRIAKRKREKYVSEQRSQEKLGKNRLYVHNLRLKVKS